MLDIVNAKIASLSKKLNRIQDKQDLEGIRQIIILLNDENDRLKSEAAMRDWGNSEQIRDMHEQIRSYENRLGYR